MCVLTVCQCLYTDLCTLLVLVDMILNSVQWGNGYVCACVLSGGRYVHEKRWCKREDVTWGIVKSSQAHGDVSPGLPSVTEPVHALGKTGISAA